MQLIVLPMAEIPTKRNVVSSTESGSSTTSDDFKPEEKRAATSEASVAEVSGYKDHSRDPPTSDDNVYTSGDGSISKEPPFPVKLHMMLSNPEFSDIVAWLPHGRSWRVLQPKALEETVIPLFFRHTRYSSFARQVNGWGFRRVRV